MTRVPPTLHTARLVLRPITDADAGAIFAACSDPQTTEHLLFPTHQTIADTRRFLDGVVAPSYTAGHPGPWAICLSDAPDRLIGTAGARPDPAAPHRMEVGYWLARSHWGRGLAVEAVAAVAGYVFASHPEVVRLFGRVFDGNPASRRVLEKAGFVYEGMLRQAELVKGQLRDDHYYSRLRGDVGSG
jgi:RimJ/RimL family protein N-acetyltransferase